MYTKQALPQVVSWHCPGERERQKEMAREREKQRQETNKEVAHIT